MGIIKEETYTAIISGLEALSGTRIKPSYIPRVWNFGRNYQIQKINEILMVGLRIIQKLSLLLKKRGEINYGNLKYI